MALQALIAETDVEPYSGSRFSEAVQVLDPATQDYRNPQFMINYVESHDDQRLKHVIQESGVDDAAALKKLTLATTILMTIPGEPMLYQGQEWGEASAVRKILTLRTLKSVKHRVFRDRRACRALPFQRRRSGDVHRPARGDGLLLAWIPAFYRTGPTPRLPCPRTVGSGRRSPLQSGQAAARPLCQGHGGAG